MSVQEPAPLTRNQNLVLETLLNSGGPLSAYTILDELREKGFRAPLQVYRAVDQLISLGMVHRLESLNAFVACTHPDCEAHETIAFMICERCKRVTEASDQELSNRLAFISKSKDFKLQDSAVEITGTCADCQ